MFGERYFPKGPAIIGLSIKVLLIYVRVIISSMSGANMSFFVCTVQKSVWMDDDAFLYWTSAALFPQVRFTNL